LEEATRDAGEPISGWALSLATTEDAVEAGRLRDLIVGRKTSDA
jgi:hypothetical protein